MSTDLKTGNAPIVTLTGVLVFAVFIVCSLYWRALVFIPIALAIFLAFVLTPLVRQLERLKLGRLPSVFVVLAFAVALFGGAGFSRCSNKAATWAYELPGYTENIKAKVNYLTQLGQGSKIADQMRPNVRRDKHEKLGHQGTGRG